MAELHLSIEPLELAERLFGQILAARQPTRVMLPSGAPPLEGTLRDLYGLAGGMAIHPTTQSESLPVAASRLLAQLAIMP
jgi:hypothetical protein